MGTLPLIWKIATGPIWLLWSGYKSLWWVFGDTHEPVKLRSASARDKNAAPSKDAKPDQAAAFEVVDSSPRPIPAPTSKLRAGFIGTLFSSAGLYLVSRGLAVSGTMSDERAVFAWLWGSALIAVLSIFMVRRSARKAREKRGLAAMFRSVRDAGACAAAGAAATAAGACQWARESLRTPAAGQPVEPAVKAEPQASHAFKRSMAGACSAARRAWHSIGRPRASSRTAA
ncbi:MAG: hypothetical protein AMXMBFR58_21960 [Phycisphaerae bacterium]